MLVRYTESEEDGDKYIDLVIRIKANDISTRITVSANGISKRLATIDGTNSIDLSPMGERLPDPVEEQDRNDSAMRDAVRQTDDGAGEWSRNAENHSLTGDPAQEAIDTTSEPECSPANVVPLHPVANGIPSDTNATPVQSETPVEDASLAIACGPDYSIETHRTADEASSNMLQAEEIGTRTPHERIAATAPPSYEPQPDQNAENDLDNEPISINDVFGADERRLVSRLLRVPKRARAIHAYIIALFTSAETRDGKELRANIIRSLAASAISSPIEDEWRLVPDSVRKMLKTDGTTPSEIEAVVKLADLLMQEPFEPAILDYLNAVKNTFLSLINFEEKDARQRIFTAANRLDEKFETIFAPLKVA